jgi:hypothetical protein
MRLLPGLVPLNAAINLWRPVTTSGPLSFNYITAKEVLIASATVNWFTAASEHGVDPTECRSAKRATRLTSAQ